MPKHKHQHTIRKLYKHVLKHSVKHLTKVHNQNSKKDPKLIHIEQQVSLNIHKMCK